MVDLKFEVPVSEEVEVGAKTLAAIDRGIEDASQGRTTSIDELRKMICQGFRNSHHNHQVETLQFVRI